MNNLLKASQSLLVEWIARTPQTTNNDDKGENCQEGEDSQKSNTNYESPKKLSTFSNHETKWRDVMSNLKLSAISEGALDKLRADYVFDFNKARKCSSQPFGEQLRDSFCSVGNSPPPLAQCILKKRGLTTSSAKTDSVNPDQYKQKRERNNQDKIWVNPTAQFSLTKQCLNNYCLTESNKNRNAKAVRFSLDARSDEEDELEDSLYENETSQTTNTKIPKFVKSFVYFEHPQSSAEDSTEPFFLSHENDSSLSMIEKPLTLREVMRKWKESVTTHKSVSPVTITRKGCCVDDEIVQAKKAWPVDLGCNRNFIKTMINFESFPQWTDLMKENEIEAIQSRGVFNWAVPYDNMNYIKSQLFPLFCNRCVRH